MKCDFCGWRASTESDTCPNCNRKYSDSNELRNARKFFIISAVVFFLGMSMMVFVADNAFLFELLLVVLIVQFLFFAIRFVAIRTRFNKIINQENSAAALAGQTQDFVRYSKITLPRVPVSIDSDSGFIYPGMEKGLKSCVEQLFSVEGMAAHFSVKYKGQEVLGFHLTNHLNDEQTAVIHSVCIHFCFTRFVDSKQVTERFMKCSFVNDFEILDRYIDVNDTEEGVLASAIYGTDVEKALKVASCILANVCYIPLNAQLQYDCVRWAW